MFSEQDKIYMQRAIFLAKSAAKHQEVPVGAVLVYDNKIIGEGRNSPIEKHDPTAHAEIMALRHAAMVIENYRLINTTLYVTLEPCLMCVGAITHARVKRIVYGADDPKGGAVKSVFQLGCARELNHHATYENGLMADSCGLLLKEFFQQRR